MGLTPAGEHELRETLSEDVFYPDHEPRTESATFRHTKKTMDAAGLAVCAVCGTKDKIQWHHRFVEWAFASAIDFEWIKGVALGTITTMWSEELQQEVEIPKLHIIWDMIRLVPNFDWNAFDPANPETFVDSPANMWPLCETHHLAKLHGIHMESFPIWVVQCCLKKGFIYSPDELRDRHGSSE
jgi:hypothetical protein